MGNIEHQQQNQNKSQKVRNHTFVLEIRDREIILDFKAKTKLMIGDVNLFPSGGFEGLHLWDSNIVLARYILMHKEQFSGKSVIQLLSGTGIASIAMKKFTHASKIAATDLKQEVTSNISKNCQKNQIDSGMIVACIAWSEYTNYKTKFDFVIGADLLYKGSSIDLLVKALAKLLNVGGRAIIVTPQREQDCSAQFVEALDKNIFSLKKQKLIDEMYMESPLLNQVEGYEEFKQLSQGIFILYTIQKLRDSNHKKQQVKKDLSMTDVNMLNKSKTHQPQNISIKHIQDQETQQQKTAHIKKQLEAVTINPKQNVPEYKKKKQKDLGDIIDSGDSRPRKPSVKQLSQIEQEAQKIEVVNKQHQLYDQPDKKSQLDKKSQNQNKGEIQENKLSIDHIQDTRMRKKSNPN